MTKKKHVKCDYCGEEIEKGDGTWVEGRLYCEGCVDEAEIYSDLGHDGDDDDEDEDEDDDDDD